MVTRRDLLKTSATVTGAALLGTGFAQGSSNREHRQKLVGTWTASPAEPSGDAEKGFNDQTVRMITHPSVGGNSLRLRFANTFGTSHVTLGHIEVGVWDGQGTVVPGSSQTVTFNEDTSITIPPKAKAYSDEIPFDVAPEQSLAVSVYFPSETSPGTYHRTGKEPANGQEDIKWTAYISETGDHTTEPSAESFTMKAAEPETIYFLERIDVSSSGVEGAIITLGDSITDGAGSSADMRNTYPDFLAERLNNDPNVQKSVLNAGIGSNRVLNNSVRGGPSALARFDRDVLSQTGVTDVILLEGINDIGFSNVPEDSDYSEFIDVWQPLIEVTADEIIQGMQQIINRAHAKNLNIIGGTILPFKNAFYYYEKGEQKRQRVNEWIRTSDEFDEFVDFDKIIRDPDNPKQMDPEYDSGDNLHPSDEGYRAMARAIDLSHFQCRERVPA